MNAFGLVVLISIGFLTERLYFPGSRPEIRNDPVILVADSDTTVPVIVVLPLTREIDAPEANLVPRIVTETLLVLYPESGVTDVITGTGLRIVKRFSFVPFDPSLFRTVTLYWPYGSSFRGRVHLIVVFPESVPDTVLLVVPFVIVTVTPAR